MIPGRDQFICSQCEMAADEDEAPSYCPHCGWDGLNFNDTKGLDEVDRSFDWYFASLRGEKPQLSPDDSPKAGFYRLKNQDETHSAVAYWYDETAEGHPLRCHLDGKDISEEKALSIWLFACKGPIPDSVYWHFIENHVWSDIDPADMKKRAVVVAVDVDIVFEQFKASTDVSFILTKLAQDAINKGHDVPGATLEYREVIKRGATKAAAQRNSGEME